MKKKVLALLLATAMVLSVAGCGTKSKTQTSSTEKTSTSTDGVALDKSWPKETVKIAVECFDTTDDQFLNIQKYYEYLAESFNIEFMYSESIASAEDELKFIENAASAGCKALIGYYNVSEGQAVQLCIDKGMYYWGAADNAGIYDAFADNELYLGGYDGGNADYQAGYEMAKGLIDQGCEKLVYEAGGRDFGVPIFVKRSEGFYAAVKEAQAKNSKIEVVYEVSGWPGTDAFTAQQTTVCDMEFDGLACSTTAAVWFQPLSTTGKVESVKLATMGAPGDMYKDFVDAGLVSVLVYECEEVQFGGAIVSILNSVAGNPEAVRDNGKAAKYPLDRWIITSADDFNVIYDKHTAGEYYVTAQDVAQLLVNYNKEASYTSMVDFYTAKTLDAAVAE